MGVLAGLDSDVWVTGNPSVSIGGTPEACSNTDSGVFKQYRAVTHLYWDKQQPLTVQVGTNEKQTLTETGTPTGGTVKLAFNGQTMAGTIASTCTAAQMKTALEALSSIGANNTNCTGGPWPTTPIVVEFIAAQGGINQPMISLNTNSLTGGSSPTITFAETQPGANWATATGYSFEYPGGYVDFVSALTAIQNVRISAGYYFPIAQLANCGSWEVDMKANVIDTSTFQGNAWGSFQAAMKTATGKIGSFISDGTLDGSLSQLLVFVLYLQKTTNIRYECYGWITDLNPKNAMSGVITKDIGFAVDGQMYYRVVP